MHTLPDSKLPGVATTIFSRITARASELGAINIGQGFPDYPIDAELATLLNQAVAHGWNQYAPMAGAMTLREHIVADVSQRMKVSVDPESEVTVTCGGTEALFDAITAVVRGGDDVILFDPAYDSYAPAVLLAGGRPVRLALTPPNFTHDWDAVRDALTERTRLIIINSPNNPSCTLIPRAGLDALADLLRDRKVFVLADEVYERVTFDGRPHASVLEHEELRARSFAVYSFGKVLHATGWRTGFCIAPSALTQELRKVHQFNTFSIAAPLQHAIADYLARGLVGAGLSEFFQRKRDYFLALLAGSAWRCVPSQGTYFQLLDYSELATCADEEFADRLIREAGVAVIPLSPFYERAPAMTLVRVCLAKRDETLQAAAERLLQFAHRAR